MSPSEAKKNAEQFLRDQAAIIKKYGEAPKLSGEDYQAVLNDTTKTFESLSTPRQVKEEE
jgi:hypothetical protein